MANDNGNKPRKWKGLGLADLRRVEYELCRTRYRVEKYGGGDEDVLAYGYSGLAGRLLQIVFEFLREAKHPAFPSKGDLAKRLDPPVQQNVLAKFFAGQATSGTKWFKHARELLWHLLLGSHPDKDGERFEAAKRIRSFFFRDMKKDNDPSAFFQPWRLRHHEPCSRSELARDLDWYTTALAVCGGSAELVWVSGGAAFFRDGDKNKMARAVADAHAGGVKVSFVYHSGTPGDRAKHSLDGFFIDHQRVKEPHPPTEIDLAAADLQAVPGWWTHSGNPLQYLYLVHADPDQKVDETLFVLRAEPSSSSTDDDGDEPSKKVVYNSPVAVQANDVELQAFKQWWHRVVAVGLSPPHPRPVAAGEGQRP